MNLDLSFFWKMFLRRLPAMAALFLLCAGLGVALAIKLPTTYDTSATLLVESSQIPTNLASSTVGDNASEQLEIIRRRLMTRANLIDISNEFNVFRENSRMAPDDIVRQMRQRTSIRSQGRPLVMTIGFSARDPRIAANVVNEYVTLILEANVQLRTGQAEETLEFFDQDLERLGSQLDLINQEILAFKKENADSLPETLNYRQGRQSTLQERLVRLEREKTLMLEQRERIETVFERTGRVQVQQQRQLTPEEERLERLQRELDNARTVYSATSPQVRILERQISQLEDLVSAQTGGEGAEDEETTQQALYNLALAEIDGKIAELDRQITDVSDELEELRISIARTSEVGIELNGLEREYSNTQDQYNQAVGRRATASMGERIELSSKGQRVTLVERAPVPDEPASPNRPMVAAAGIGIGMGAAAGLFLLLELLNRTIRRPAELISRTGITPLAIIPYMETPLRRRARRLGRVALFVAVVVAVPAALWAIDTYYQPLELMARRLFDRVGIS